MAIDKKKWHLPSVQDGSAFTVRATTAEKHLIEALDLLNEIHGMVPHRPSGETKGKIDTFLNKFK